MPRAKSKPRKVECILCGTEFLTRHSQGKFCSARCRSEGARQNWRYYDRKNRDDRRLYQRKKYKRQRIIVAERVKKYRNTTQGKKNRALVDARRRKKHPQKYYARMMVNLALKTGMLTRKPCEKCGDKKVEAHHPDYQKPLDVMWLCRAHHTEIHRAEK